MTRNTACDPLSSVRGCLAAALLMLTACHSSGGDSTPIPGDRSDTQPYDAVGADEELRFRGTEPFWGGEVTGNQMVYRTTEQPNGRHFTVSRFNGRGGFSFSGRLEGKSVTVAFTPGQCSDGMSERLYPFVVMLQWGAVEHHGCAWSQQHPYHGPAAP